MFNMNILLRNINNALWLSILVFTNQFEVLILHNNINIH